MKSTLIFFALMCSLAANSKQISGLENVALLYLAQTTVAPQAYPQLYDSSGQVNRKQVAQKFINWNVNLTVATSPVTPAFWVFYTSVPSALRISAHVGLKHRRIRPGPTLIGWGLRFGIRHGQTESSVSVPVGSGFGAPPWIKGAKTANNLINEDQHYAAPAFGGYVEIPAGWHRVELWGNCHPDASEPQYNYPGQSWLEVNADGGDDDPYNRILYEVSPLE